MEKRPVFVAAWVVLAVICSASTWFYVNRVLKPQQIADAIAHNRPRGNFSDLYPRWLGARELLVHHRNPYSPEITREIQRGYYGRPLDPSSPEDPKDQQAFAYPAYVVFLLAPTIDLPFEVVQAAFRRLLVALAVLDIYLWLLVVRWKVSWATKLILAILALGWLPMVQGIKLQQLTLLVAAFMALSMALLGISHAPESSPDLTRTVGQFCAGAILALATIKPQLAWFLVLFLLLWAFSHWRARLTFILGFFVVMLSLFVGAEMVLPGWFRMFLTAIAEYRQYTHNPSVLVDLFGSAVGHIAEFAAVLVSAFYLWSIRREPANSPEFGRAVALVLAVTVLVVPMVAPYNQILLIPAILVLLRAAARPQLPAIRIASFVAAILIAWYWIATLALALAAPWLTPGLRERVYLAPLYTSLEAPVFVFGLVLLDAWMNHPNTLRVGAQAR